MTTCQQDLSRGAAATVRVLDLTRVLAGPTCARTLAEHGADVFKIIAAHLPNLGHQEYDTGHGKLSAHLDLREPKDLETLRGLVRETDVFAGPAVLSGIGDQLLTGYLMAFGAMVALARRAREGGTWLVRISLTQTGRWLVGRGQVPGAEACSPLPRWESEDSRRN